ncbi:MAG: hypothetical protein ACI4J6_04890 [Oscillospiraceae bacterium]
MNRIMLFFKERKKIIPMYIAASAAICLVLAVMTFLQSGVISENRFIHSLDDIIEGKNSGDILCTAEWLIAEIPEGQVMRTWPAAVFMLAFALLGYYFERRDSRFRGTDIAGGKGAFFPLLAVCTGAMLLANAVYFRATENGWAATFISFCSLAPTLFFIYGTGVKKVITEIVLGGLAPVGFAVYIAMPFIVKPLGLPAFVSAAIGMAVTVPLCVLLCRRLPWMTEADFSAFKPSPENKRKISDGRLFIRRLLADPSELICWGSSWATVGMYIGSLLAWVLNPSSGSCAEGRFPEVMCCQLLTIATSIFIWFPKIKRGEPTFTFSGFVIISAFINTYEMSVPLTILSIFVAAVFTPLTAELLYSKVKFYRELPACCSTLSSFCIVCITWSFVIMALTQI